MNLRGIMYIPNYEKLIVTHCCNNCGFKGESLKNHTIECNEKPYIIFGKRCPIYNFKDYIDKPLLEDFRKYVIKSRNNPYQLIVFS